MGPAHQGSVSICRGGGQVHAFEAIPHLYKEIAGLYAREAISHDNVTAYHIALTKPELAEKNFLTFHHVRDAEGYSGIMLRPEVVDKRVEKIHVPCATLDTVIPEHAVIKCIKMDVEHGEFDVLRGAERILRTSKPVVVFEFAHQYSADLYNYSKDNFFRFFKNLHYELFQFTGGRYSEDMWNNGLCYWEMWAVHCESPYLQFFTENYPSLCLQYVKNQMSYLLSQK